MSAFFKPESARHLRVIADNLEATCRIQVPRIKERKTDPDGYDICTGVLVAERFILTSGLYITTQQQARDSQVTFFYQKDKKSVKSNPLLSHPLNVKLDPDMLFYRSPPAAPRVDPHGNESKYIEPKAGALSYTVIGIDQQHWNSIPPSDRQDQQPLLSDVIPVELLLNDPTGSMKVTPPNKNQEIIVVSYPVENSDMMYETDGAKKYHADVVEDVQEHFLTYSCHRNPEGASAGAPVFNMLGECMAFQHSGGNGDLNVCSLVSDIVQDLRMVLKKARHLSSKTAKENNWSAAVKHYQRVISLNPNPAGHLVFEALNLLQEALVKSSQHAAAKLRQGEADLLRAASQDETRRAIELDLEIALDEVIGVLSSAIESNSRFPDAYIFRALIYQMQGKLKNAMQDWNAVIELLPNSPMMFYFRGHCLYEQGLLELAEQDYSEAIKLFGDDMIEEKGICHLHRGNAFADLNELRAARKDYTLCIKLIPDNQAAYFSRGNILKEQNKLGAAITDFNKVLELNPTFAAALYERAKCYHIKVKQDIEKAYDLDPQPAYGQVLQQLDLTLFP